MKLRITFPALVLSAVPLLSLASPAMAQPPPRPLPMEAPPPINDPAPSSPIDRPKSSRADKQIAEAAKPPEPPPPARGVGVMWLGWTVGTGYGWHPTQELETAVDPDRRPLEAGAAFGPAAVGHFGPEFGFQYRERIAVSIGTRHQIIPKVVSDPTNEGSPKQWAHSILARAMYIFPRERLQPYLGGLLGGGSGFRFRIEPQPSQNLSTSDTVRGGPIVLGPVAGVVFPILNRLSLVGEVRALVGVWDVATLMEGNLGLQFDL